MTSGTSAAVPRSRAGLTKASSAVCALVLAIMVAATVSCSRAKSPYEYSRVTLDGQTTLAISSKQALIRGVIVYFHDVGSNEFALTADDLHTKLTGELVDAGFAVVSSNAGGDAFGNASSQRNYLYVGGAAADHFRTENIYFLAESMGALAAVNLLAQGLTQRVRGFAAINPILDLANGAPQHAAGIAAAHPGASLQEQDPMNLPLAKLTDQNMRFYVSPDDTSVPASANALRFQERFGQVSDISIVDCSGGHGDPSCFQGNDIVKWFSKLEAGGVA